MSLFYREQGKGTPLVILHGLFGMSDNWLTISKKLSDDYRVIIPDQRNHGKSFHSKEWNYQAMVDDVFELIHQLEEKKILLMGHSMGGKVAMKFVQQFPELVEKFVVIDIAPRYYPVHHESIIKALKAVKIDHITSRTEAEEELHQHINNLGVRQFLLKNLGRSKEGFHWKFNLDVISENIENVGEAVEHKICEVPGLFIGGSNSDYINGNDIEEIKNIFTNAYVIMMKNAGHWVHADQPDALISTLRQFFSYQKTT